MNIEVVSKIWHPVRAKRTMVRKSIFIILLATYCIYYTYDLSLSTGLILKSKTLSNHYFNRHFSPNQYTQHCMYVSVESQHTSKSTTINFISGLRSPYKVIFLMIWNRLIYLFHLLNFRLPNNHRESRKCSTPLGPGKKCKWMEMSFICLWSEMFCNVRSAC